MSENRREAERFSVSLYAEHQEAKDAPIHIRNLSASGFLVRGDVLAGQGGILHASFRVHPAAGELRVSTRGRVMHCCIDGSNSEFGVMIEDFGSQEEESAYRAYVSELALLAAAQAAPQART
jgi:hypothetical protein